MLPTSPQVGIGAGANETASKSSLRGGCRCSGSQCKHVGLSFLAEALSVQSVVTTGSRRFLAMRVHTLVKGLRRRNTPSGRAATWSPFAITR